MKKNSNTYNKTKADQRVLSYCLMLFVVFASMPLLSQINSFRDNKLLLKANNAFNYGDYFNSLKIYEKLYSVDSTDNEINYKIGVCNFEIKKYRNSSKKYFEKTSTTDFPETNYYLGRLYHLSREYDKAIKIFNDYKNSKGDKEHTSKEIDDLITKANTAITFEANPDKTVQIRNMGKVINTEYPEYAPLIPAEENFIIFTSRRKNPLWNQKDPLGDYFEDIYISKKDPNVWQVAEILDTNINTSVHDASTGLSADGEKLLLYRTSKDLKSGDIYESFLKDEKWMKPTILGENVNSKEYLETSACYSPDGEIIFFSSNRPGGFGGKDLYFVKKLPNGNWAKPFNPGSQINTEYNEDAPFVHPTGNTLYFSSEGNKNMGGFDIFKSNFDETGGFTSPENLGYPINTADDDIFFVLNTKASTGYLSSEREGGFGSQDIYKVKFSANILVVNVYNICVLDSTENIIKKSEITLTDSATKKILGIYKSNKQTGKILVITEPEKEYQLTIYSEGFEPLITKYVFGADNYITYKLLKKKE